MVIMVIIGRYHYATAQKRLRNLRAKLQLTQNSAARLITGTKKYSPITPVLQQLHWLPVKSRISFKILLLTFQCLHNMAPSYLHVHVQELLNKYTPTRNLRSSQKNLLECPV